MSAFAAPIEVVQAALHRVGEESIVSLDEGSAAALVVSSNYEGIVRSSLTKHAWSFATETVDLTLVGTVAKGLFVRAYALPASAINLRWVEQNGSLLRNGQYQLQGGQVLTVAEGAYQAVVTVRATEAVWPDDFAEAIVVRLHGLFLESLCDKPQDGRLKIKDSKDLMREAILRDRRQSPGMIPEYNRLASAWRGGRPVRV